MSSQPALHSVHSGTMARMISVIETDTDAATECRLQVLGRKPLSLRCNRLLCEYTRAALMVGPLRGELPSCHAGRSVSGAASLHPSV